MPADDIFAQARVLTGAERERYLSHACGDDAALRRKLDLLLRADAAAEGFLAEPEGLTAAHDEAEAGGFSGTRFSGTRPSRTGVESAGDSIGPYRLLQPIGEGGFGTVWMAEQREPIRRRVAVKVIKVGMDTKQVIARFEAERQALALMEHPNIAKVLDAGATQTGRPYFVMELVRGMPIVEFCDEERLDTRKRLELFTQVCRAVHHAHQKGIIHRDIKPSNVLVTLHDGEPVVKVIDFGIAKATSVELTQRTLFTEHRQMVGTPVYMSPEQAALGGLDIDTRSDVYSLGVLLYELLTGTTPFDAKALLEAGMAEMLRVIREEEPRKPSTRLSMLGEAGTRTAELRRCEPQRLRSLLRGDLDWIAMKCLEKDRIRRYDSANGLALDVERHLAGKPVTAAPPGAAYLAKKFVRRHRVGVAIGGVVAALVFIGTIGTSAGLVWALREQDRAEGAAAEAIEAQRRAEASEALASQTAERAQRSQYGALILAADNALQAERVRDMRIALDAAPEHLRGWEWHLLNRLGDQSDRTIRTPDGAINGMALTPDDRHLLTLEPSGVLRFFDVETGVHLRDIETGVPRSTLVMAPSGTLLLVSTRMVQNVVRAYAWPSGHLLWERRGLVSLTPFSSDERQVAISVVDAQIVLILDAQSGQEIARLATSVRRSDGASISPDGTSVQLLDLQQGAVCTIDLASGEESFWSVPVWGTSRILDAARGRVVVADSRSRRIVIHDIIERRIARTFDVSRADLTLSDLSPDGRLALGHPGIGGGSPLDVIDLDRGERIAVLRGPESSHLRRAFSGSGRWIMLGAQEPDVRLYAIPKHDDVFKAPFILPSRPQAAAICPQHRRIAGGGWGVMQLWDARTGALHWLQGWGGQYIERVAWRPDGGAIAFAEIRGEVLVVGANDGQIVARYPGFSHGNTGLAWLDDGRTLLLAGGCGALAWIDVTSGQRRATLAVHEGPITAIALSPDKTRLAATRGSSVHSPMGQRLIHEPQVTPAVAIVDLESTTVVARTEALTDQPSAVAFSPCGRRVVVGGVAGELRTFDHDLGTLVLETKFAGTLHSLAFDHAGSRVAVGVWNRGVSIVDAAQGTVLISRSGHGRVLDLCFIGSGDAMNGEEGAGGAVESLLVVDTLGVAEYTSRAVPPELGAARQAVADVRRVVDPVYERMRLRADVIAELEADASLDESLRAAAIDHARRRSDHFVRLRSDMIVIARISGAAEQLYLRALRMLDRCEEMNPELIGSGALFRALLHHRIGDLDGARRHLDRFEGVSALGPGTSGFDLCAAILIELAHGNRERAELLSRLVEQQFSDHPSADESTVQIRDEVLRLLQ
ncbi:MAG TPA: WD40 repeat domain-containing serine/threonine-protein kinase [Phycisphaerales bacterium]|nr:WD40 repeat domain-containing serine/threonine-protein kinase [Phycisphaerales bacterium]HMP37428.1 WD40 repeat domain-containing serine/threonine-protein kinase [Phycisphaerales bacterium]